MGDRGMSEPRPISEPLKRYSLLRSSSMVVGARIAGAALGILIQMLLAIFLSAEHIGLFFFSTGCAAILSIVCTMGYPALVPKIAAQSAAGADNSLLPKFMARARLDTFVLCVAALGLLIVGGMLLPNIMQSTRDSLFFAALMLPAFAFLRLNGALANALKRFELGFLPELFVRPLCLLLFVLALWFFWEQMSIQAVLIANGAIATIIAVWQLWRVTDGNPISSFGTAQGSVPKPEFVADWRGRAVPLVLAGLFIGVFADLTIVVSRFFLDGTQTGIFGVCLKISLLVGFAIQAVHQLILRDTADALQSAELVQVRSIIRNANAVTLAGSIVSFALIYAFGSDLLGLFGEEFKAGYGCLLLLMLAQVLRAAAGPATQVLTLTGQEKHCLPVFAVSIVVLVLGNTIFVPWLGLSGAALAVLIVFIIWPFWSAYLAHRQIGIRTALV